MRLCGLSYTMIALGVACALPAGSEFSRAQVPAAEPQATTEKAPASAPRAVFESTAALVLVDVLVSNGVEPVHGIARQQFHLFEDGKEQKLIALEEHRAADPATVNPPELPPNIYTNIPAPPSPELRTSCSSMR